MPPILTTPDTGNYLSNATAQIIAAGLTVTDDQAATLDGAKVSISTNFNASCDRSSSRR